MMHSDSSDDDCPEWTDEDFVNAVPAFGSLVNIVDHRERPYRWRRINAVIEATGADNCCVDADQAPISKNISNLIYEERRGISFASAIAWASKHSYPFITLYIYDEGCGI